jgi:hypothetical protein
LTTFFPLSFPTQKQVEQHEERRVDAHLNTDLFKDADRYSGVVDLSTLANPGQLFVCCFCNGVKDVNSIYRTAHFLSVVTRSHDGSLVTDVQLMHAYTEPVCHPYCYLAVDLRTDRSQRVIRCENICHECLFHLITIILPEFRMICR